MSDRDRQAQVQAMAECLEKPEPFPADWAGRYQMGTAYEEQLAGLRYREGLGRKQVGWKVGLTSLAMQKQQGVDEPCMGYLLEHGHLVSGSSLAMSELVSPGFENELCVRLGAPLSGKEVGFAQAAAAIEAIAPALEIVEKRANFGSDFAFAIAGNVQQRAFVTGPFRDFDADMDLATTEAQVFVNDELQETATGAEVLGNPINSIIWLADMLSRHGLQLHAGDLIMTGSFTKQYAANPGGRVTTRFAGLGDVTFTFEDR